MGKIILDWDETENFDFDLIGISTNIPDYKLVHKLNEVLHIDLARNREDFEIKQSPKPSKFFSWYSYLPEEEDLKIYLIVNKSENNYLVEEIKQMNSFLLIFGELNYLKATEVAQAIKNIPLIISSTVIDVESLKSKNNFVFFS